MHREFRRFLSVLAGLGIGAMAPAAWAMVANIPEFQDATLLGGGDATANASLADPGMFVGTDGQDNPKRGLIEFNIQQYVPPGATIISAKLQLTVGQTAGSGGGSPGGTSGGESIGLFNEPVAWGQSTNVIGAMSFGGHGHGAAPNVGDATWNFAFFGETPAEPWAIPGGDWSSSLTDIADASVTGTLTSFTWSSTAMVADVQGWLDNPDTNNGWILKGADEVDPTDFRAFWSAQGAANNNAPATAPDLIVTYSVPEPASISLLGLALPMMLTRRRRTAGSVLRKSDLR